MTEYRIMLLGANGQVGQALQAASLPSTWVISGFGHKDLDLTQHHAVQSAIATLRPDLIINSAALTAVDVAEGDPALAMAVNFTAVANIAAHASARDIPVIHISTDYVFDGKQNGVPYKPDDVMHPVNVYGESKMMGEEALRQTHAFHVILRISSVFSAYGKNLLTAMLGLIDERDELFAFTDMTTGPTAATEVARSIVEIGAALLKGKHDGFGIFHLCGAPPASRHEFTEAIMAAYAPYTDKRPIIHATLSSATKGRAPRPAYTVFDCEKIRRVYGIEQKPWRDGLKEAMNMLMKDRALK